MMPTLPVAIKIGLDLVGIWFYDLYREYAPDFESLLIISANATLQAIEEWFKLLLYFCRLIIRIMLLLYPYIKSLDITVQLSMIGFIVFIIFAPWITKKIQKIKNRFTLKWHKLISWISIKSQITAKILPHLIWWFILCALLWFIPQHIYASHHLLLFIACFIIPAIKTNSIIRQYSELNNKNKNIQKKKYIDSLQRWLQFWCCRGFILFTYYICCYILSYIPPFIVINNRLFEIICDWTILWLLVIDGSLYFLLKQLTTKIFQFDISIKSSSEREIQSTSLSLADKISLSSINWLLTLLLTMIRPFVSCFVYRIIKIGLYQFLIFISFFFISPILGSYILGYLLSIYSSILALHNLHKNENEANNVIPTIINRLKYWMVFATLQWIYYLIEDQMGIKYYVPLWNHAKFVLILWIQLPYVPYSCCQIYKYIILPFRVLDVLYNTYYNYHANRVNDDHSIVKHDEENNRDDKYTSIAQNFNDEHVNIDSVHRAEHAEYSENKQNVNGSANDQKTENDKFDKNKEDELYSKKSDEILRKSSYICDIDEFLWKNGAKLLYDKLKRIEFETNKIQRNVDKLNSKLAKKKYKIKIIEKQIEDELILIQMQNK